MLLMAECTVENSNKKLEVARVVEKRQLQTVSKISTNDTMTQNMKILLIQHSVGSLFTAPFS